MTLPINNHLRIAPDGRIFVDDNELLVLEGSVKITGYDNSDDDTLVTLTLVPSTVTIEQKEPRRINERMTFILAPNEHEGLDYARAHGYEPQNFRVITPHSRNSRGVNATDLRIVGNPQFTPGALFDLGRSFVHSQEALAVWEKNVERFEALAAAE